MHALPGACDDAAFQGGFSAFGTETCKPWNAQAGALESGPPIPRLALPPKGLEALGKPLPFWEPRLMLL